MYMDRAVIRHFICYVIASVVLTGCWTSKRDLTVLDRAPKTRRDPGKQTVIERLVARVRECYVPLVPADKEGKTDSSTTSKCAEQYSFLSAPGQPIDQKMLRNAVVNDLLIVSDDNEKKWRTEVKAAINTREITLDIGALLLSTAGGVVPHASLAKIFSASSAGVQGANTAWDKRYIGEQTVDLVINAVASARLTKKADILNNLQQQSVDKYGISDGIRDAVEYDSLLTLQVGVSTLQQTTAEKSKSASEDIKSLSPATPAAAAAAAAAAAQQK